MVILAVSYVRRGVVLEARVSALEEAIKALREVIGEHARQTREISREQHERLEALINVGVRQNAEATSKLADGVAALSQVLNETFKQVLAVATGKDYFHKDTVMLLVKILGGALLTTLVSLVGVVAGQRVDTHAIVKGVMEALGK